eukprot:15451586-Alexandrium_andersonii.AAC.1
MATRGTPQAQRCRKVQRTAGSNFEEVLRFPVVSCGFLCFPAVSCGFLRGLSGGGCRPPRTPTPTSASG